MYFFSFIYIVILTQQISHYFHNYWGVNFLYVKIIKYIWNCDQSQLKINVLTLVRWMCKSYSTFGLFNIYFFFFSIIDLCSFFLYIKARMRIQCFCAVHLQCHFVKPHCLFFFFFKFWTVTTIPSWFNQICWAKVHYSTYNFFELTFCNFFFYTLF